MLSTTTTSKNKTYCILLLYIGLLQLIFYWIILPEKTTRQLFIEHRELLEYQCCITKATDEFHWNLVFLKPNTIGGSLILNVLLRFSLRYNLNVFIPERNENSSVIPLRDTETIDNNYNVLLLFDKFTSDVYNYAYPNTFTVTIIENPINVFQTLFNEYKASTPFGNFKDFVNKIAHNVNGVTFNPTSTRLGLKPEYHNNETEIENFIQETERKFDLVMIYEFLGPSLIFLANLMGWPLEYVINMYSYISPVETYNFTDVNKLKLEEWNRADIMLYQHFFKKLENCALQYGVEQLVDEMKTLAELNEYVRTSCLNKLQKEQDEYTNCDSFVKTEDEFIQILEQNQIKRMKTEKSMDYYAIY